MTRRDPAVVSRTMSRIRGRDTLPELALRRELHALRLRYRVDYRGAPGRPDVAFPKQRVAVFVDGEFWHGKDWPALQRNLKRGANPKFWIDKIRRNKKRDRTVRAELRREGWRVLAFWAGEVLADPRHHAELVWIHVKSARSGAIDADMRDAVLRDLDAAKALRDRRCQDCGNAIPPGFDHACSKSDDIKWARRGRRG